MRKLQHLIDETNVMPNSIEQEKALFIAIANTLTKVMEEAIDARESGLKEITDYKTGTRTPVMSRDYIDAHLRSGIYTPLTRAKFSSEDASEVCKFYFKVLNNTKKVKDRKKEFAEVKLILNQIQQLLDLRTNKGIKMYLAPINEEGYYNFKSLIMEEVDGDDYKMYPNTLVDQLPENLVVRNAEEQDKVEYELQKQAILDSFASTIDEYATFYQECVKNNELPNGKQLRFNKSKMYREDEQDLKTYYAGINTKYGEYLEKYKDLVDANNAKLGR
jgi:hypothetical protein